MAIAPELLAQANLKKYTKEEIKQKRQFIGKLINEDNIADAGKVDCPISVRQLDGLKHRVGIEKLIKDGVNLSLAVKEYGYEWLQS